MSGALTEFARLLKEKAKSQVPVQTEWVTVTAVDWEAKSMTATGNENDLEYFDIDLGLGSVCKRPVIGTTALVGTIHNGSACYMIDCEEFTEILITDKTGFKILLKDGLLTLNGDSLGGIVKADELKAQVDKNTLILQKMQEVFDTWAPVSQDGGAALKAMVTQFTNLQRADLSNIKNDKIKHG